MAATKLSKLGTSSRHRSCNSQLRQDSAGAACDSQGWGSSTKQEEKWWNLVENAAKPTIKYNKHA